ARKIGVPIEIARIGIRDSEKPRIAPSELFTADLGSIVDDPTIDVVLELMGGLEPALHLIERALKSGKHVVTANKELIAKHGARLVELAARERLDLHFEAAVGGGIPLIQPLKHQLAGNDVIRLMGIVNGTTNVILTKMTQEGAEFEEALAEAQAKGYAEADPSSDVDGYDAQYKIAILSSIAFGKEISPDDVYREGIGGVTKRDIAYADVLGYTIKLLGIAESRKDGLLARVHPTLLPKDHPLASVNGVYNAVWVQGDFVGDVMFSGRGAGSDPTGSAVVGDLIDVSRNIRLGGAGNTVPYETGAKTLPIEENFTRFYFRVVVNDRPKVLGTIAMTLGDFDVSLAAMEMRLLDASRNLGEIVFLTHPCKEANFRSALDALGPTGMVEQIANWLRVEGTSLVVEGQGL
ncbi:MAG: homoserine dehydrogenase, partial [Fimbriimonadaceae bacterium]|nr:homoserine dehydrogenase [Fimbriimonadaceae bacterium]